MSLRVLYSVSWMFFRILYNQYEDLQYMPLIQPQLSGLVFVCRFLSSSFDGAIVGLGEVPSSNTKAELIAVGVGPPNATARTVGRTVTRLRTVAGNFIL